jgi:hypothetical protein
MILTSAAVFTACSQSPSEPLTPEGAAAPDIGYPSRAVVHWSDFFEWDEATADEAAKADVVIFPISRCFSPLGKDVIVRMRAVNPDIKILGYLAMLQVGELYPDTSYLEQYLPWELDFYRAVEDNWAWTTTGDTFHVWPGVIFLDPIDGSGRPDMELLESIVGLLDRYVESNPGMLDGVMHDYFMYTPYVSPFNDNVDGEVDLDGDGIVTGEDEDEQAAFLRWQKDYAAAIRSRLGPDFIQVANGRVPQEDGELAASLNGIFYEQFPNMTWSLTDRAGFEVLLRNQEDGWLAPAFGRTWSIVTNTFVEYNNTFCMLSSLLTDCFYADLPGDYRFGGWSVEIEAGRALSGLAVEGRTDSIMSYRRTFTGGEAVVSFNPNGGRRDWTFIENN